MNDGNSKMTHTPGPWDCEYDNDSGPVDEGYAEFWLIGTADTKVCDVWSSESDARLIAAAPDLLAACKAVVEQDGFVGSALMRKRIAQMKVAIAKAEGSELQ